MSSIKTELEKGEWVLVSTKPAFIRQNKGNTQIVYIVADSLPVAFDQDTATMRTTVKGGSVLINEVSSGASIYAYAISDSANLSVTGFDSVISFLSNMVTDLGEETSRFKVDSQPSSFEENAEFKIFYRLQDISQSNQLVIKFTTVNALNIMARKINLWDGGREYLVYGDDGTHTSTGTFTPIDVFSVNNNVEGGGAHPVSQVTASIAIGSGIFVPGSVPSNGDGVLTASNANRTNNQPLADSNQSGVKGGSTFYLVFNHIGENSSTDGHFYLQWEERF